MSKSVASRVQVFPSGPVPANLLRWHLFFDRPVDACAADGAVTLLNGSGEEVPHAFVDVPGGLWDESGTQLTVLMHPGRLKSGLQAHAQHGGALADGQAMSLSIDLERLLGPCAGRVHHAFSVGPAEGHRIEPKAWRLNLVEAGTLDPLVIRFDRPMDRLSLEGAIALVDATGKELEGRLSYAPDGAALSFDPRWPWQPGAHKLMVAEDLEDVAGNRVAAPFESSVRWTQAVRLEKPFTVLPSVAWAQREGMALHGSGLYR